MGAVLLLEMLLLVDGGWWMVIDRGIAIFNAGGWPSGLRMVIG